MRSVLLWIFVAGIGLFAQASGAAEGDSSARPRTQSLLQPRAWLGVNAGLGYGGVELCHNQKPDNCTREGLFGTYGANVTLTGAQGLLRLRATRGDQKGGNLHMPYEEAALIGSRFGRSSWYGALGYSNIVHPHDGYTGTLKGVGYDLFFPPSSGGPIGFELSFHGMFANEGNYEAISLGLRFGNLR
jgi:hypothetical protein